VLDGILVAERHAQRFGDRRHDPPEARGLCEIAEPHTAGPVLERPPSIADGEAGLSHAGGAEERHQAGSVVELGLELAELRVAPD
jgi:hypothetical protein